MKTPTRVLGLDLGTELGWAVWDQDAGHVEDAGNLELKAKSWETNSMRPFRCRQAVLSLLMSLKPDMVVYEIVRGHRRAGQRSDNIGAAHVWGELRGAVLEACEAHGTPCTGIEVSGWKRYSVGKGNASKDAVAAWALSITWQHPLNQPRATQDALDAVGIAYAWAHLELEAEAARQ